MKKRRSLWAALVLCVYLLSFTAQAAASYLTDEEIVAAAQLIRELTAENDSLRRQVDMLEDGMKRSEEIVKSMSVQMQAWDALQESRNKLADDTIQQLLDTLNHADDTIDRLDRRLTRAEGRADFWRTASMLITIGGAIAIGSK